jgi:hypothetical protein
MCVRVRIHSLEEERDQVGGWGHHWIGYCLMDFLECI